MFLDDFTDTFKVAFQTDPEQNLNKSKTTNQSKIHTTSIKSKSIPWRRKKLKIKTRNPKNKYFWNWNYPIPSTRTSNLFTTCLLHPTPFSLFLVFIEIKHLVNKLDNGTLLIENPLFKWLFIKYYTLSNGNGARGVGKAPYMWLGEWGLKGINTCVSRRHSRKSEIDGLRWKQKLKTHCSLLGRTLFSVKHFLN